MKSYFPSKNAQIQQKQRVVQEIKKQQANVEGKIKSDQNQYVNISINFSIAELVTHIFAITTGLVAFYFGMKYLPFIVSNLNNDIYGYRKWTQDLRMVLLFHLIYTAGYLYALLIILKVLNNLFSRNNKRFIFEENQPEIEEYSLIQQESDQMVVFSFCFYIGVIYWVFSNPQDWIFYIYTAHILFLFGRFAAWVGTYSIYLLKTPALDDFGNVLSICSIILIYAENFGVKILGNLI